MEWDRQFAAGRPGTGSTIPHDLAREDEYTTEAGSLRNLPSRWLVCFFPPSLPLFATYLTDRISVCIVSILRITSFNQSNQNDPTYTSIDTAMWSSIEQSVGIVCACLPTLRPLFRRLYGASAIDPYTLSNGSHSQSPSRSGAAQLSDQSRGDESSTVEFARLSNENTLDRSPTAYEMQMYPGHKPGIDMSVDTLESCPGFSDAIVAGGNRASSLMTIHSMIGSVRRLDRVGTWYMVPGLYGERDGYTKGWTWIHKTI